MTKNVSAFINSLDMLRTLFCTSSSAMFSPSGVNLKYPFFSEMNRNAVKRDTSFVGVTFLELVYSV